MESEDASARPFPTYMDITLQHFLAEFFLSALAGLPISEARNAAYEISGTEPSEAARAIDGFARYRRWARSYPYEGAVTAHKVGRPAVLKPANDN